MAGFTCSALPVILAGGTRVFLSFCLHLPVGQYNNRRYNPSLICPRIVSTLPESTYLSGQGIFLVEYAVRYYSRSSVCWGGGGGKIESHLVKSAIVDR